MPTLRGRIAFRAVNPNCIPIWSQVHRGVLSVHDEFKSVSHPCVTSHTRYVRMCRVRGWSRQHQVPLGPFIYFHLAGRQYFDSTAGRYYSPGVYGVVCRYVRHREVSVEEPLWLAVLIVVRQLFSGATLLYIPLPVSRSLFPRGRAVEYKSCRIDPHAALARPFVLVSDGNSGVL